MVEPSVVEQKYIFSRRFFGLTWIFLAVLNLFYGAYIFSQQPKASRNTYKNYQAYQRMISASNTIHRFYIDSTLATPEHLADNAIHGMVNGLDIFSYYSSPEMERYQRRIDESNICGIGASLGVAQNRFVFMFVEPNSSAELVGIREGDVLLDVNGFSLSGMELSRCRELLVGDKGTYLTLTVQTPAQTPRKVDVKCVASMMEDVDGPRWLDPQTMLIRIREFSAEAPTLFLRALQEGMHKGAKRLIVDVRGCPGGELGAAVEITSLFLAAGERIVALEERHAPTRQWYTSTADGQKFLKMPMAILIDPYTASCAELFSGALRDHQRAQIFGEPSYGKGVAQKTFLLDDGGALHITTAKYFTPRGYNVNYRGVEPNYYIPVKSSDRHRVVQHYLRSPGEIKIPGDPMLSDDVLQSAYHALKNVSVLP